VLCAVCKRPLHEGAAACIVCGAPTQPNSAPAVTAPGSSFVPGAVDTYAVTQPSPIPQANATATQVSAVSHAQRFAPAATAPPITVQGVTVGEGPAVPLPPTYQVQYAPNQHAPFPQGGPMPMQPVQNNYWATIAFVCGLLGLVPFFIGFALCLVAVVCGIFGISRASDLPDGRGRGFAIAGLVLGLVFLVPAGCGI
jgi:hypothetical protein